MIELYHVCKAYNGWPALHDVSFKIDKGEFVFLTGPSGAGKTTLLRLIFRADAPDEGQILVNDRNLLHVRESEVPYLRRMNGLVFQDFRLLPKKTDYENVALALRSAACRKGWCGCGWPRRSARSGWGTSWTPCCRRSPPGSSSGCAWRGRSSMIRRSFWRMSPRATWTRTCRARSWSS